MRCFVQGGKKWHEMFCPTFEIGIKISCAGLCMYYLKNTFVSFRDGTKLSKRQDDIRVQYFRVRVLQLFACWVIFHAFVVVC